MSSFKYYVLNHPGSKMQEVFAQTGPPDYRAFKAALKRQMEPIFLVVKGEIAGSKAERKRGVWAYSDNKRLIYFTCPWCGAVQTTDRRHLGGNNYDSIWCGYAGDGMEKVPGCNRHLMLFYVKDPADPRLVYLEGDKKE